MLTSPVPDRSTDTTPPGMHVELRAGGTPRPGVSTQPSHSAPRLDHSPPDTATTRLAEVLAVLTVIALYVAVIVQLQLSASSLPIFAPH